MAATTIDPPTPPIRRLTADDVLAMAAAGILHDDERVELEDGVLVQLSPQDTKHEDAKEWLNWFFGSADLRIRVEAMFLTAGGCYVLPDLVVAQGFPRGEHPRTAPLVIEVANTSLARDRGKAVNYACAGVADYWIVDVANELVIVHRDPAGDAYASVTEHRHGEVHPLLPTPPIVLDELFGR